MNLVYEVTNETGPSHDKTFEVQVLMENGVILGHGVGKTKKEAEQTCKNLTTEVTDDYKTLLKTLFGKANNTDKQKIINAINDVKQKKSIVEQTNTVVDSTSQETK